ncbi:hypothetical protein [Sporichthya sp.]|uniref:hypothetical protein n=1 Tax=Sporichthya sp. TaxID=65475 RepID=UPI00181DBA53|nr:hypothetical protein [Sporichthya sp.]MBA3742794.1 hypothetical protein [Sporichthya sp.]
MNDPTPAGSRTRRRRAAALLLATGAVLTASGTWAAWQSTGSLTQNVDSANVTVNVAEGGSGAATWSTGITNLLPGDYFYRWMDITNTGSVPQTFAATLTGSATLPSALTAWVSNCTVAFTAGSTTCSGSSTDLLGSSATPAAFGALSTLGSVNAGAAKHLLVKVVFSASANQVTYQNQSSTLTLSVTGTATGGNDRTNG